MDEALEELRKSLVDAMRSGSCWTVNLGDMDIDFKNEFTNEEIFPAALVFNWHEWRKEENHLKFIKPHENIGFNGQGTFRMHDDFKICLVTTSERENVVNL